MHLTEKLSNSEFDDLGEIQNLREIFNGNGDESLPDWQGKRIELVSEWENILGKPAGDDYEKKEEVIEQFEVLEWKGTVFRQTTGADSTQQVLLMEPEKSSGTFFKAGAVVPFYKPDLMAGVNLLTKNNIEEHPEVQFGKALVRKGFTVVCTEAFPYNYVEEPEKYKKGALWEKAAEMLLSENPGWTGIGKLISDTRRAVDLILKQEIDKEKLLAIGHSLGGKMAFASGGFDERIKIVIASDFGMGWKFTNWNSPWYYGKQIDRENFSFGNHHVLALNGA